MQGTNDPSPTAKCQMCCMEEDEIVEGEILECEKYGKQNGGDANDLN